MKINNLDDVSVEKKGTNIYEVSTIYNNRFVHKVYVGYTRTQAINRFKDALKKGEL